MFNVDSVGLAVKAIRTEAHDAGTYNNLFSCACTMRGDLDREIYTQRLQL